MNIFQKVALVSLISQALVACGTDDNDQEIRDLQTQITQLEQQLDEAESGSASDVAGLQRLITELEQQLSSAKAANDDQVAELEAQLAVLQGKLDEMNRKDPVLGANATSGVNRLTSDSDRVWRFAVIPDTQGRDDDNMKTYVSVDRNGNDLGVSEWIGVDFNGDGYYDAGTESQKDSVKPGDWDEDGISYLVNVQDPFHPFIETNELGAPIVVQPEDRKDYGPDWKILPKPLVEAVADKMIELNVDLVLATGDITEYRAESDYVQWMSTVAKPLQQAGVSIFPVRGNHEIVNGRNWPAWFTNEQEWERQSVNNVYNGINPYVGYQQADFDQGYRLYQAYTGKLVQEHLTSGKAVGFPGSEDLVYYFIHNNTLFIALDFYFADINNGTYKGTWLTLRDWLQKVIKENAADVDHIVAYGHEPLSTKKRPQTFDAEQYDAYLTEQRALQAKLDAAQTAYDTAVTAGETAEVLAQLNDALDSARSALAEIKEPSLAGYDIGQLGYLMLQDEASPGLAQEILNLFTQYKVTYISGHDHQYARSLIHADAKHVDTALGFTQIIGGNASWKAYENQYGINKDHETGLYINNFYDSVTGGDLYNSQGLKYANVTSSLGKGISFVLVEVNGRQITTTAYYADHSLTEVDMNLGAHYDFNTNSWCTYTGDYMVAGAATTETCTPVEWQKQDQQSQTTDATVRVVAPEQNYFTQSKTPETEGYLGSEATIIDGYNLTYDTSYASTVGRTERLRELFSLSWFADTDATTLSDVLLISGNQTQDGSFYDDHGDVVDGASPSLTYVNEKGCEVNNPTHVTRDGQMKKGTDLNGSLSGNTSTEGTSNCANWSNRYDEDGLDFADAYTISFKAPVNSDLTTLTVGRYDEGTETWVPAFPEECFVETGYSDHYSVYYRISEQEPEAGYGIAGCQQRYWGYVKDSNSIWGFLHTDGRFALIKR